MSYIIFQFWNDDPQLSQIGRKISTRRLFVRLNTPQNSCLIVDCASLGQPRYVYYDWDIKNIYCVYLCVCVCAQYINNIYIYV